MRYVLLEGLEPVPSKARDESGRLVDAPFTCLNFVRALIDSDRQFVSDAAGLKASLRIEEALEKADRFLQLEESDWSRLRQASDTPTAGFPLQPARRLLPFINAIQNASEKQPAPKQPTPKGKKS